MSKGKRTKGVEHVNRTSPDLLKENIARLRELFPESVSEGKIDFAKLREGLGLKKDDLFICRNVALTDEQVANLALQCNLKTI